MNPHRRLHSRIHAELDELVRREILTTEQCVRLKERYSIETMDFMSLVRAFTVLGILTAVAGLVVLVRTHLNWWFVSEGSLTALFLAAVVTGFWLKRFRNLPRIGEALELVGAMALQGLTAVLAVHLSAGSKNWPGLVGLDVVLLFGLAYLLANRLVLWYACANFFFWFGAETGYVSGWGMYWLGMTYPVRFLAAGVATLGLSWLHGLVIRGRWAPFSRVYMHFGMLITNLALWFLSLFGYFEDHDVRWEGTGGERLMYSLLWAAAAGGSLYAGIRLGLKLLRGYGLTFLIINLYTFYFQFVVANTGELGFIHLLVVGGSLLWLGFHLERKRREASQSAEGKEGPDSSD